MRHSDRSPFDNLFALGNSIITKTFIELVHLTMLGKCNHATSNEDRLRIVHCYRNGGTLVCHVRTLRVKR